MDEEPVADKRKKFQTNVTKIYTCLMCMKGFVRKIAYDEHIVICTGPGTTTYKFEDETYTHFNEQNKTDPPPFNIFFDTETPIADDTCTEPTLLLGSYTIVVVFSDNILANKDNNLKNFTVFRSKKMPVTSLTKLLVPSFMRPSIKEEDARAVCRAAIRVQKGITCAFNELLFTDLQLISNTVKAYLYSYIMPIHRYLSISDQQTYIKAVRKDNPEEMKCYLCNLPVSFSNCHIKAAQHYAHILLHKVH